MMAKLRSPRKSIFNRPSFSMAVASYWVTMGALSTDPLGRTCAAPGRSQEPDLGDDHAAAWMPSWRRLSTKPLATSTTCFTSLSPS